MTWHGGYTLKVRVDPHRLCNLQFIIQCISSVFSTHIKNRLFVAGYGVLAGPHMYTITASNDCFHGQGDSWPILSADSLKVDTEHSRAVV